MFVVYISVCQKWERYVLWSGCEVMPLKVFSQKEKYPNLTFPPRFKVWATICHVCVARIRKKIFPYILYFMGVDRGYLLGCTLVIIFFTLPHKILILAQWKLQIRHLCLHYSYCSFCLKVESMTIEDRIS